MAEQRSISRPIPTVEVHAETQAVLTDRGQLEAVLIHLVENAQQATNDNGFVKLVLRANAHRSTLEIIDNGCGMDAEFIRTRLFKPFDTTKGNAGMGIGVYEAREFIHSLDGSINVSSAPGEGTTFTIELPCVEPHAHAVTIDTGIAGSQL